MLKIFDSDDVTVETIEEIRNACEVFLPPNGQTEAYESLMTDPQKKAIISRLREGRDVPEKDVKNTLVWFLNWYRCRFPHKFIPDLLPPLKQSAIQIRTSLSGVTLETLQRSHFTHIVSAYETLCDAPHVGGTTASKILSVTQPETFMMWDIPIAEAYGVNQNAIGYCRFLLIMRDIIRRLRSFEPPIIETQLSVRNRGWTVPITKFLDEWNWVTITNS